MAAWTGRIASTLSPAAGWLKGAPREDLFNAVRVVYAGGSLLQPVVASKLLRQVSQPKEKVEALTPRELQVLHLRLTYSQALQKRYLWHEFGDLHLILP